MSRPVYLVVYHSRLFAAHWSLWIPKYENETVKDLGTIIQVEGDPSGGFHHEFKRNYNVSLTRQTTSVILLGYVDGRNIIDSPPGNVASIDSTATDVIENWAVSVQAPGPSLRSASASTSTSRVELQNCQTWLRALAVVLIEKGIFPQEALQVLDQAPKN